ncbi:MAG TPA: glycosyltransferase [Gemmatimonadaceae bacterium]
MSGGEPSSRRRRVLLVTYPFFPSYHVGVRRVAQLCRHLPEHGWEPVVLTKDWERERGPEDDIFGKLRVDSAVEEIGYAPTVIRAHYESRDNALLRAHRALTRSEDGSSNPIVRMGKTVTRKVLSALYPLFGEWPDRYVGWIDFATRAGVVAAREHAVDAVISLCPPHTAQIVGSRIAKRTGLPWVTMFDDLTGFFIGKNDWHGTSLRRRIALAANRATLRRARRTSANTPAMLALLGKTYGLKGEVAVPGYGDARVTPQQRGDRMRIAYTGRIYPDAQRPGLFFDALDLLISRDPRALEEIEVTMMGTGAEESLRALLSGRPSEAIVRIVGARPVAEALALQQASHLLLVLHIATEEARAGTLSFPAKTYEYLAAGRRILAIPGDVGGWGNEILRETDCGTWADTAEQGADELARALAEWRTTGMVAHHPDVERTRRFSARAQAGVVARLLDESLADARGARGAA